MKNVFLYFKSKNKIFLTGIIFSTFFVATFFNACLTGVEYQSGRGEILNANIDDSGRITKFSPTTFKIHGYLIGWQNKVNPNDANEDTNIYLVCRQNNSLRNLKIKAKPNENPDFKDFYFFELNISDIFFSCDSIEGYKELYFYRKAQFLPVLTHTNLECIKKANPNLNVLQKTESCLKIDPALRARFGNSLGINDKIYAVNKLKLSLDLYEFNRCKKNSFCVHAGMPILSQSNSEIVNVVNQNEGLSIKNDPGWCAPTAQAMIFRSIASDYPQISNQIQYTSNPGAINISLNNISDSELIYHFMKIMKTDILNGGTYFSLATPGLRNLYSTAKPVYSQSYNRFLYLGHHDFTSAIGTTDKFVKYTKEKFYLYRPYFVAAIRGSYTEQRKVSSIDANGVISEKIVDTPVTAGHALAFNGVENGSFKIFDPWGRIYTVNSDEQGLLSSPVGDRGFVTYILNKPGQAYFYYPYYNANITATLK